MDVAADATALFARQVTLRASALLLGERLDTRALERGAPLGNLPLMISLAPESCAVLFRYGVVVLFGMEIPERAYLDRIAPLITEPQAVPVREETRIVVRPDAEDQIEPPGDIVLRQATVERLQLVADILARNLVLGDDETRIRESFDRIEPLAATLRDSGRIGARGRTLLRHIGQVLITQHRMVGRVEVLDKPELLWEHPELERLYARLEAEYELRDRSRALDRKHELISRTVETLVDLLQSQRSLRVEWYIVLLIVAEFAFAIYTYLGGRPH
jgi:required for meiotic nuclear division protein 1